MNRRSIFALLSLLPLGKFAVGPAKASEQRIERLPQPRPERWVEVQGFGMGEGGYREGNSFEMGVSFRRETNYGVKIYPTHEVYFAINQEAFTLDSGSARDWAAKLLEFADEADRLNA